MKRIPMITHIKWLFSSGQEGFVAAPEWLPDITKAGIRCPYCEGIRPESRNKHLEVIICGVPRNCVNSTVSAFWGGQIFRCDLIEVIGKNMLDDLCFSLPVRDRHGKECEDFQFLIEKKPRGVFRGTSESDVGLCPECGRLLYWPMPKPYLLRRYWDGTGGVTVMNDDILCTPDYFREVLGPKHFPRLKGESRALADEPLDGLPADYDEMVAELRRQGRFKKKWEPKPEISESKDDIPDDIDQAIAELNMQHLFPTRSKTRQGDKSNLDNDTKS
jgi:hypothetical protein